MEDYKRWLKISLVTLQELRLRYMDDNNTKEAIRIGGKIEGLYMALNKLEELEL